MWAGRLQEVAALGVVSLVEGVLHVLLEQPHLGGGGRAQLLDRHGKPRARARLVAQPGHVHAPLLRRALVADGVPAEEGAVAVPRVLAAHGQPCLGRAVLAEGGDELLGRLREDKVHAELGGARRRRTLSELRPEPDPEPEP